MTVSPWQVMSSNAGYYVGRDDDYEPYDRRSGYFKTREEAEQELCGMRTAGHTPIGLDGRCAVCNKIQMVGTFIASIKLMQTTTQRKKALNDLTKSELDHVARVLQLNPLIKTKAARVQLISEIQ